ncbi:hypothetical protein BOTBODRAFT_115899 [Botryobasidium botryosum FD-172 SS1]|uniref:ribonuclease Z n=1 Tax=Botryobasidium botryosum (strain FD-172 SS1) TaxID=930990 RepID=A0A067M497_BOTB1|nr:hypothetical protein BOTBODRAFT_115899 [Botryobasidium botryosum FD-172 SS1]
MAKWVVRVLAAPTVDTEPAISVHFESSPSAKYLFGCGEGILRASMQQKYGMMKTKAIFVTGVNTERSLGLPGTLMSAADGSIKHMQLYGPEGLAHYIASTRFYAQRDTMAVSVLECPTFPTNQSPEPLYSDVNMKVFATPILPEDWTPSASNTLKRKRPHSPGSPRSRSSSLDSNEYLKKIIDIMYWVKPEDTPPASTGSPPLNPRLFPGAPSVNRRLPFASPPPVAMSYLGVGPAIRGKFDAAKALSLGVPNGPVRKKLINGESITTDDGKLVTPDMCIGPSSPPAAFLFVDCPSPSYIPGAVKDALPDLSSHPERIVINLVIHRVGPGVIEDKRYRDWMNTFDPNVHHLIASETYCPNRVSHTSSAYAQLRLAELDPEIFRVPAYSLTPSASLDEFPDLPPNVQPLAIDLQITMAPPGEPKLVPGPNFDRFHNAILGNGGEGSGKALEKPQLDLTPATEAAFDAARADVEAQRAVYAEGRPSQPGDDIVVTPLGTGSALPSKYRNVSATLLQIPGGGSILLDCGEGTWGQMCRQFGTHDVEDGGANVFSVLRDIRCIFISHIHGDHHMGLSRLLAKRKALDPPPSEPLYLIANWQTVQYLNEFSDLQDIGLKNDFNTGVRVIGAEGLQSAPPSEFTSKLKPDAKEEDLNRERRNWEATLKARLRLESVATVDVIHRARACYGVVIKHRDGWSVVYSGDTLPCEALVLAGQNATLLIHEATMADEQADIALVKAHSTLGQAIKVGLDMKAKHILLTHFSQRYPKMPPSLLTPRLREPKPLEAESTDPEDSLATGDPDKPVIALAFDHASIRVGSMWKMARYIPAIQQCYDESEEPLEETEDVPATESATRGAEKEKASGSKTKEKYEGGKNKQKQKQKHRQKQSGGGKSGRRDDSAGDQTMADGTGEGSQLAATG